MNCLKSGIAGAAAMVLIGTSAFAGGLADAIVETPVMEEPVAAAPESSVPGWVIPVAILAVVIGLASSGDDDDDGGQNGRGDLDIGDLQPR